MHMHAREIRYWAAGKPGLHDSCGLGWVATGFVRLPPRVRFPARILASLASHPALHASPRPPSARTPSSRPMMLLPLHSHIAHARRHAAKDKREARRRAPTADSRPSAPHLAGTSRDSIEVSVLAKTSGAHPLFAVKCVWPPRIPDCPAVVGLRLEFVSGGGSP